MRARRWTRIALAQITPILLAIAASLALGALLILALGKNPLVVYGALLEGAVLHSDRTGWFGPGQALYKATTLTFTGVAVALGFRAGLFNIGAEGQLCLGGFAAALTGLWLAPLISRSALVEALAPVACMAAAFAGGTIAAALPAALKAWRGAHEVIVTLMMNFVIVYLVNMATRGIAVPETVHTRAIPGAARLGRLDSVFPGASVSSALWVAIAVAIAAAWLIARTRRGFEMRALGEGQLAAEAGGVRIARVTFMTLLISGGIAGLGGINFVLGNRGYFEKDFMAGAGFLGIAVALVARNRPLAVPLAALFFGVLSEGAVAVGAAEEHARVPREVFEMLEGIVILGVVSATVIADRASARSSGVRP